MEQPLAAAEPAVFHMAAMDEDEAEVDYFPGPGGPDAAAGDTVYDCQEGFVYFDKESFSKVNTCDEGKVLCGDETTSALSGEASQEQEFQQEDSTERA